MTHWRSLTNPNYIGAYAFEPNEEKTGTIAYVREEPVMGADGKKEDCTVVHFSEKDLKPLIMNVTNAKSITKLYGTPYIEEWAGKKITMVVRRVKAFGDTVDAVRIKPEIPVCKQAEPVLCADCAAVLTAFGKMSADQLAHYTKDKYGRALCAKCAKAAADDAGKAADTDSAAESADHEEDATC